MNGPHFPEPEEDSNAAALAEACIEDLMTQAREIKYDVVGLIERRHRPLRANFKTGEELLYEASAAGVGDSRCVGV
ncbi:hypothetical protein V3C99_002669 [Haemonchus contortus]|uniref:Peptidase_M24 domain-containing protein n=1 Tax=Haemonchus contortus TaxID=6289 RepID=A0A7I4YA99_HAECO